jgi:2-phospho-L-lactate guanylyltransferase (CobY/MobA/RfbA family)
MNPQTRTSKVAITRREREEQLEAILVDVIRSLVEDIILTPVDGKVEIDVRGDLAGILTLSAQTKNPAGGRGNRK